MIHQKTENGWQRAEPPPPKPSTASTLTCFFCRHALAKLRDGKYDKDRREWICSDDFACRMRRAGVKQTRPDAEEPEP